MGRWKDQELLLWAGVLLLGAALLRWPEESVSAMRDGLQLCGGVMVPALFPFFVLASLVVGSGLARRMGGLLEPVMRPLFRVNGSCAAVLALGLVGGYPVGARTAVQLYREGQCSRAEAERLLSFCNNCGPAFLLGAVGAGIFGSVQVGLLLWAVHGAAALLVGLLFRFYGSEETVDAPKVAGPSARVPHAALLTQAVSDGVRSALNLCGFLLFFAVVLRLLTVSGVLTAGADLLVRLPPHLSPRLARQLLTGFVELSSGVAALTEGPVTERLLLAAFLVGWGGVSVHGQALAFLADSGLSLLPYFLGKLLHGLLSVLLLAGAMRWLPLELPVSVSPAVPAALRGMAVHGAASALWLGGFFLLLAALAGKKQ